jgi:outer membrane receptor protein involved in Fe transport
MPEWGDYHYTSNAGTLQTGMFIQDQAKLGSRWHGEFGLRYDKMKFNKIENPDESDSQVSPRLGLSYSLNDSNLLKASWGRFIQFPPSYVMERIYANPSWNEYRLGNQSLNPERSVSWDVSWERQLGSNSTFRLTPFYKTYTDLLQSRKVNPNDPDSMTSMLVNSGRGKSTGVEGYVSKKLGNNWEGWLSYTWMRARANASSFMAPIDPSVWSYTDWDQRHTLNAVVSYRHKTWEHNWQLFYGSGLADTVDSDTASYQRHGNSTAVFSWNITKKLPKGSSLGDQVSLNIWNLFNVGKATHYSTYMYPSNPDDPESEMALGRDADSWIVPRFITLGVQRKF